MPELVKPSVSYKGQTRKGHVRKKVSTDKSAIKNRNRSRYYYQTCGVRFMIPVEGNNSGLY
jgi:hypothetical protein